MAECIVPCLVGGVLIALLVAIREIKASRRESHHDSRMQRKAIGELTAAVEQSRLETVESNRNIEASMKAVALYARTEIGVLKGDMDSKDIALVDQAILESPLGKSGILKRTGIEQNEQKPLRQNKPPKGGE